VSPVGDANGDGIINGQDIALVASNWLAQGNQPLAGDVNFDGIVNGQDMAQVASQWGHARGTLALGTLTPPLVNEGVSLTNFTVSHFHDTNPLAKASDYTAQVLLGDGTTINLSSTATESGRIVADPDGGFNVQISHVYTRYLSHATFSVMVNGPQGQSTRIVNDSFSVADAPLTAGALTPPAATQFQPLKNAVVFHFTDANPYSKVSDFTARVTLGDGHIVTLTGLLSSNGRIVASAAGGFDVQLSYTYTIPLTNQAFTVTVSDTGGQSTSASTNAFSVAPSTLIAGGLTPPLAIVGTPFTDVTVFHFTDIDANAVAGDFTAQVILGDGNTVNLTGTPIAYGRIVANPQGGFDVRLSYKYTTVVQNQTFGVFVTDTHGGATGGSTTRFAVSTATTQYTPEIHLDATNTASVSTTLGGALFNVAQQQYLTEPDNVILDNIFNNARQLTIQFQARQTTLDTNRNFLSKWNYGGNGTIAIATGQHYQEEDEISVWFAGFNGDPVAIVQTVGAHLQASVTYDIAVVYNAGQVQIYVNGQPQQVVTTSGAVPTSLAASTGIPLDLGRWNGMSQGNYLDGALQNLNIWMLARTQAQIQSMQGDTLTYAQMSAQQKVGLAHSFTMVQDGVPVTDAVYGYQLLNPTGIMRQQIVNSWSGSGTLPTVFTPSPAGQAPDYLRSVATMNSQSALRFNGLNNALKYASTQLPDENSGDVFIVVQFTGGGDNFEGDTLFSASSDTTATDYVFFASYNGSTNVVPPSEGGGIPLPRFRFRNGDFQTDIRGSQMQLQPGVTYVLHYWGLGTGKGYGMTLNGLDVSPFYTTSNPEVFASSAGAWFGASANLTNLTIGDFERSDGPQGFAAALISQIDVYAGTTAQPVLPLNVSQQIVDSLLAKYGATRLGSDE